MLLFNQPLLPNERAFVNECAQFIQQQWNAGFAERLDIIGDERNFIPHAFTEFLLENAESFRVDYSHDYDKLLDAVLKNEITLGNITPRNYQNITAYLNQTATARLSSQ